MDCLKCDKHAPHRHEGDRAIYDGGLEADYVRALVEIAELEKRLSQRVSRAAALARMDQIDLTFNRRRGGPSLWSYRERWDTLREWLEDA